MFFSTLINHCYTIIFPRSVSLDALEPFMNRNFLKNNQYVLFQYKQEKVKELIYYVKRNRDPELCKELALLFYEQIKSYLQKNMHVLVIPVPISQRKRKQRGFNQTELMAFHLSKLINSSTYAPHLFVKKDIQKQSMLSKTQRKTNATLSFHVQKDIPNADLYIIIDDLITTGATMQRLSSPLIKPNTQILHLAVAH